MEQKIPEAQEWSTIEQAVPLQPTDTTQSRSPHTAMEKPVEKKWMRPEGDIARGEPLQEQARLELQPRRRIPWWGRRAGKLPPMGSSAGAVPEWLALCYRAVLEELQPTGSTHENNLGRTGGTHGAEVESDHTTKSFLSPNMGLKD